MTIPKIIHQTYATREMPDDLRRNVERLQAMNPGWQHVLYDDADIDRFILANYGQDMLDVYRRIHPGYGAARADLFRYLLMFRVGGVYLDIKSTALRPLDEIVLDADRYVLAYWPNLPGQMFPEWGHIADLRGFGRGEFQNWHIIAEPAHPFLRRTIMQVVVNIKSYNAAQHGVGKIGVLRTTGPVAYSRAIGPILTSCPHRLAGDHLELGLQYNIDEKNGLRGHTRYFGKHYSQMKEPLILDAPQPA